MNEDRRKSITVLQERLAVLVDKIDDFCAAHEDKLVDFREEMEDIGNAVTEVKEEEEGARENLAPSLQDGEQGAAMQEAVVRMEEAESDIHELKEKLDTVFETLREYQQGDPTENAAACLESAKE